MFFHLDWTMEQLRGPARATAVQLNAKLFCEPMPRAESPGERRRRYIHISSSEVRKSGLGLWTYVASDELRQAQDPCSLISLLGRHVLGGLHLKIPKRNALASVLGKRVFDMMAAVLSSLHIESDSALTA